MMNYTAGEISFYVDSMIVEAIIEDPSIVKNAGVGDTIMSLINKVKDYFASKIDPNNKVESVLNMLAPGTIGLIFSSLGMPWIGVFLALAQQVFKINVGGAVMAIYERVKSIVMGGQQMTSQQIDSIAADAVKSNSTAVTESDEAAALLRLQRPIAASSEVKQRIQDARVIKLSMIAFNEGKLQKKAWIGGLTFAAMQGKFISILITLLGWVFKIALGSAGAIITGDAVSNFLKRTPSTSGFFSSLTEPSKTQTPAPTSIYVAKQTVFKPNPSYSGRKYNSGESTWAEGFVNNRTGISDMLIQFAKEVYLGLNGLESLIQSTETFQEAVNNIEQFNMTATGSSVVFLPRMFTTKKQIVDLFIDDVANKAPKSTAYERI